MDGGSQRRSFTYISDGIDCLMKILENRKGAADGGIFNVGNPANDISVRGARREARRGGGRASRLRRAGARDAPIVEVDSRDYYGDGYQDILTRVPSIRRARALLGWEPKVGLDEALRLHRGLLSVEAGHSSLSKN